MQGGPAGEYGGLQVAQPCGDGVGKPALGENVSVDVAGRLYVEGRGFVEQAQLFPTRPPQVGDAQLVAAGGEVLDGLVAKVLFLGGDVLVKRFVGDKAGLDDGKQGVYVHVGTLAKESNRPRQRERCRAYRS